MFDWSAETANYEDIMALNKPASIPKIGKYSRARLYLVHIL